MKALIRNILFGHKSSSERYVSYLKRKGVEVGTDVTIFCPRTTTIDVSAPHLLTIGNHIVMTGPVTILTHDYSWAVLKRKYGDIVGNKRVTHIGNNVFIGWGATILGGSIIGDDVIIGASSVVSGMIESGFVYAGNPAKKIMSIDEYYEKRKAVQLAEAKTFYNAYKKRFGKIPEAYMLDEYFFVFSNEIHNDRFDAQLSLTGNYTESNKEYETHVPIFPDFNAFAKYCEMSGEEKPN